MLSDEEIQEILDLWSFQHHEHPLEALQKMTAKAQEADTLKEVGAWLSEISILLNDGTEIWLKDWFEDDIDALDRGEMPFMKGELPE